MKLILSILTILTIITAQDEWFLVWPKNQYVVKINKTKVYAWQAKNNKYVSYWRVKGKNILEDDWRSGKIFGNVDHAEKWLKDSCKINIKVKLKIVE